MDEGFACLKQLPEEPASLVRGLQMIQAETGFISPAAIQALCAHFHRSRADVEALLDFYPQFSRIRPGRVRICVCGGAACHPKNRQLLQWLKSLTGIAPGETDAENRFSVETVGCLGSCRLAPAVSINGKVFGNLDKSRLSRILNEYKKEN